ncbi:MAG TPA: hypothetical protein PKK26_10665 [Candidatus Wallbacteria bacterium]|nr:hypothetical protein [Candidatus Wallbacteria bacterium]
MRKKRNIYLIALILIMSAFCAVSFAASFDTITKVGVSETADYVRVAFTSNEPIKFTDVDVRNEANGGAVVCDFLNAQFDVKGGDLITIQKGGINVLQMNRIKDSPKVCRATFILEKALDYKVYKGGNEIYIHFFKKIRDNASSVSNVQGKAEPPKKYSDILTNDSSKYEFHFENLPVEEVVKKFAAGTKLNVIIKNSASGNLTAHSQGTLYEVLEGVFKYNGFNYTVEDDSITITGRTNSENLEVALKFHELTFHEIAEAISEMAGINLVLDKDVAADQKISFYVHKMKIIDAIKLLANMYDYVLVKLDDSSYVITSKGNEKTYSKKIRKVFNLKNSTPSEVINVITQSPELSNILNVKNFSYDNRTNSLLAFDTPRNIKTLEDLLVKIDQGIRQVDIEVKIVEIGRDSLSRLGVKSISSLGFADITKALKVENISATMEFLENNNKAKVLASPRLLVVDGKKASTLIGEQVPVPSFDYIVAPSGTSLSSTVISSGTSTTGSSGSSTSTLPTYTVPTTTTVNGVTQTTPTTYLPVKKYTMTSIGISLRITPKIHSDTEVTIDLNVDVSSLISVTEDGQIHMGTRNTNTIVRLKDNNTAVFGGIIKQEERSETVKVPMLGDIPRLGKLFTHNAKTHVETEMIMLITPHITPFDMPRADEKNDGVNEIVSSSFQY